jgi:uncharacterized protein YbjT (DUF2867 family)
MDHHGREILVTGATGTQGRAVVRHLLKHGYRVRALSRDPGKPAARALAGAGVTVVKGDLEDRASLDAAMKGAHGVFSLQNFWEGFPASFLGAEGEIRQGKNVADAAKAASVQHFVYSSGGGAGHRNGVAHLDCKHEIERYLRALRLPATIIRPVFFMDNFDTPAFGYQQPVLEGRLELPLLEDKKLQMVAAEDIGHFVAQAFDRPEDYLGAAVELAGDALTMTEIAAAFTRVMGRPVRFVGGPAYIAEIRKFSEEFASMYTWFNESGFEAFLPGLRALHPGLVRFEQYLRGAGWEGRGKV